MALRFRFTKMAKHGFLGLFTLLGQKSQKKQFLTFLILTRNGPAPGSTKMASAKKHTFMRNYEDFVVSDGFCCFARVNFSREATLRWHPAKSNRTKVVFCKEATLRWHQTHFT